MFVFLGIGEKGKGLEFLKKKKKLKLYATCDKNILETLIILKQSIFYNRFLNFEKRFARKKTFNRTSKYSLKSTMTPIDKDIVLDIADLRIKKANFHIIQLQLQAKLI